MRQISVGSEKLITYEAATRIDLLKSVHINGAVSVNEVDSLCKFYFFNIYIYAKFYFLGFSEKKYLIHYQSLE